MAVKYFGCEKYWNNCYPITFIQMNPQDSIVASVTKIPFSPILGAVVEVHHPPTEAETLHFLTCSYGHTDHNICRIEIVSLMLLGSSDYS